MVSLGWSERKERDPDPLVSLLPSGDFVPWAADFNNQAWTLQRFAADLSQHFEDYVPWMLCFSGKISGKSSWHREMVGNSNIMHRIWSLPLGKANFRHELAASRWQRWAGSGRNANTSPLLALWGHFKPHKFRCILSFIVKSWHISNSKFLKQSSALLFYTLCLWHEWMDTYPSW